MAAAQEHRWAVTFRTQSKRSERVNVIGPAEIWGLSRLLNSVRWGESLRGHTTAWDSIPGWVEMGGNREVVIWTDILKLSIKGCCWDQMCKVGIRISYSQITHLSPEMLIHLSKSHLSTRQSARPPDLWLWAPPPLLEHQMVFLKQSCSHDSKSYLNSCVNECK